MRVFEITLSSILGAALGVALSYYVLDGRLSAIENKLDQTSPVAVIDFFSIAKQGVNRELSDDEMKRRVDELRAKAQRLADQGFVVLRHGSIHSAPERVILRDVDNE